MNEFLATLLQAVLLAVVPVGTAFLAQGIRSLSRYASAKTDNALAQKYLDEAAYAIATAVSQTNQTYVDALKKSGKFTKENQQEALGMAIREAVSLMRHETIAFLKEAYGDMDNYLVSQIEAEVRKQKLAEPALLGVPVGAADAARESLDPATVAEAAAAATAERLSEMLHREACSAHSEATAVTLEAQNE